MFVSIDVISNNNCSIARLGVGLNMYYESVDLEKIGIFWYLAKNDSMVEEGRNFNLFEKKCVGYDWNWKLFWEDIKLDLDSTLFILIYQNNYFYKSLTWFSHLKLCLKRALRKWYFHLVRNKSRKVDYLIFDLKIRVTFFLRRQRKNMSSCTQLTRLDLVEPLILIN